MPDHVELPSVWLVGTGGMAVDYAKVLQAQNVPFTTIGRGEVSAARYADATGLAVTTGSVEEALRSSRPDCAIVAVGVPQLRDVACALLEHGVPRLLLEKPGGAGVADIAAVADAAGDRADVRLAYNRRFYASTLAARDVIDQDGGVTSFTFEFTEWLHVFRAMPTFDGSLDVFLANSTHVIDMAFHLAGFPTQLVSFVTDDGDLINETNRHIYTGAGVSSGGALFAYHSNWNAPGRWAAEILTPSHRLIFRPLEQLQVQKMRSVAVEQVAIDDALDKEFKPGLYREVEAFLTGHGLSALPTIHDQLAHCDVYEIMKRGGRLP